MNTRVYSALLKLANGGQQGSTQSPNNPTTTSEGTDSSTTSAGGAKDDFFNRFATNNPDAWSALKWGGGAFLVTALLAKLFGSDNALGWGLAASLPAAGYGLYRNGWFDRNKAKTPATASASTTATPTTTTPGNQPTTQASN